jgi:glutaredoxin 3
MLELIIASPCPYCDLVVNFIHQNKITDIPITDTKWDPKQHEQLKNAYGKSQVPLLLINNQPLFESLDIIDYIKTYRL